MKNQKMERPRLVLQWRSRVIPCVIVVIMLFAGVIGAQEKIGTISQPLTIKDVKNWTENGNVVPVCWETTGYDREKAIVKAAVAGTWEFYANVRFTGWGACPTSGSEKQVRIHLRDHDATDSGAGGSARLGMGALSSADENDPHVNLEFNPDGTADRGRVEYVAVHEFGHVLGFIHEQDTPGNVEGPAHCNSSGNEAKSTSLTQYDRDSIMNYCNRDGNGKGNLTDIDIVGVQAVYGVRIQNIASSNSCASSMLKQTASLAWAWNDGSSQTSIAVYPSDRAKFQERTSWISRSGGWADSVKWTSGDFNGDGRTDIAAAWNNAGHNTLTVRLSTGSTFNAVHWLDNGGGWSDSSVWLPGDFNKDGRTDMAGVWNNGGQVSIAVYLSDGTKFLNPSQWSLKDGGWGDSVKWAAGDFNGDGRTDIGAAWDNNGTTTLTVRESTGSGFKPVHWQTNAGNWRNTSVFVAGDFNNDGLTDLARLWDDVSQNSVDVYLSNGGAFQSASVWSTRDGGWIQGAAVKWIAGDFNGDGRTDIGAAWNNDSLNTLTVRQSTGSKFTTAHWAIKAGGWRDSASWCSGQFKAIDPTLEAHAVDSKSVDLSPYQMEKTIDVNPLAAKGESIANQDPLSVELRNREPEGASRRGFDIGMAAAEGQTLPGPGKQKIHDSLPASEQQGFDIAVAFSLERNRNANFATKGAAIAILDPIVAQARTKDNDVLYWLGFDIATGIFGDPAQGAQGNTATGPGSLKIRDSLSAAGQRGFNASVSLHLSRKY